MQNIEYFEKPSPYIIIDEFLQPRQAKKCLEEAIRLEPFYENANITADQDLHTDNCEECKKLYNINRLATRENDVVYMDNIYDNKRTSSIILESLHQGIQSNWFQNSINKKGFFHILKHVTTSETILSRYGKCDFYGWHTDTMENNITGRIVTLCYYLNEEPEKFEGGEIILTGETIHDSKKIQPKHNRAVIFQSDSTVHAVNTVKLLNKDFSSGRFSINFWLGFTGTVKFR